MSDDYNSIAATCSNYDITVAYQLRVDDELHASHRVGRASRTGCLQATIAQATIAQANATLVMQAHKGRGCTRDDRVQAKAMVALATATP
ncbi:hypothetical protein BHE74_00011931 [Ensete ventricosum]|nr:hypothetical protein BHE74_00011931 [Ensete ventricosum]